MYNHLCVFANYLEVLYLIVLFLEAEINNFLNPLALFLKKFSTLVSVDSFFKSKFKVRSSNCTVRILLSSQAYSFNHFPQQWLRAASFGLTPHFVVSSTSESKRRFLLFIWSLTLKLALNQYNMMHVKNDYFLTCNQGRGLTLM